MARTQKNAAGEAVPTNTSKFNCAEPLHKAGAAKTKTPAKSASGANKGDD